MFMNDFGNINSVKCIVCSAMKGKEVILGLKLNTFEKNVGKTKIVRDMPHLGKKEREFYVNKNAPMPRMK
jgi:hypothetical protein